MFSDMKLGTNVYRFPDFSSDVREIVDFVRTAEKLGYSHMRFLDHVVGIVAEKHGGIAATPYTDKSIIREVFTLIAYLSALTSKIEFTTGILVLPQRQTALVAKQVAEIDIYSGGRITLGIGLGYNDIEYQALGADFKTRAAMMEEQVQVLRLLWTENDVSFEGRFHKLTNVSLSPRPLQRPIPLYFGMGRAAAPIPPDAVLARCGRLADGWLPIFQPDAEGAIAVQKMHNAATEAGRDPSKIVMEMGVRIEGKTPDQIRDDVKIRRDFGASRLNFLLPGKSAAEQTEDIKRLAEVLHLG